MDFRNFRAAELEMGPLTVVVGGNATGKSNLREAFRFLHGLARGYTVAEAVGEKWVEGGVLQWTGTRGGLREAAFSGQKSFSLEVDFDLPGSSGRKPRPATYRVEVQIDRKKRPPRIVGERLVVSGHGTNVFDSHPNNEPVGSDPDHLTAQVYTRARGKNPHFTFLSQCSILAQVVDKVGLPPETRAIAREALGSFADFRFLDLEPKAMRQPSFPGQTILGDRGENLSSVLSALCEDERQKAKLMDWLRELTPMDVSDLEFVQDAQGKLLLKVVEEGGPSVTAHSASDGTLRFLAILASLIGPNPARLYFIEELEVGIHPTRLNRLLQLIESQVRLRPVQLVVTTHSPWLLEMLSPQSLECSSLTYRLAGEVEGHIVPLLELPEARRVLKEQDLARLHAAGWLEDVVACTPSAMK